MFIVILSGLFSHVTQRPYKLQVTVKTPTVDDFQYKGIFKKFQNNWWLDASQREHAWAYIMQYILILQLVFFQSDALKVL